MLQHLVKLGTPPAGVRLWRVNNALKRIYSTDTPLVGALHLKLCIYRSALNTILFALGLLLVANWAFAAGSSLHIRSATLTTFEEDVLLNADAEINLSPELEKAINKGFVFNFLIEFQLNSPKKYWFDDEIVTTVEQVSLSYHALTRQYIVARHDQQRAYATLDEALEDLSIIQDVKVFQKTDVEKNEAYRAVLLMRLDYKKLPKALQVEGMTSSDLKMSSQRFEWSPALFK